MEVMSTLLIVGVMDDARADITGNGNIQLTSAERLSQVCVSIIHKLTSLLCESNLNHVHDVSN